ncbi:MAG: hypothetical protein LBM70_09915 [Victivallales bacterium]|nr:hypothetical protein [Victivallales bacterium]
MNVSKGNLNTSYDFDTADGVTSGGPTGIDISVSSGGATGVVTYALDSIPTSNFTISMNGKLISPAGGDGSQPTWSASGNAKAPFYIKSNQNNGAKEITVSAGTSVTYTAYEDNSSKTSNWTVNSQLKNNESSIIFNRNWWNVPGWFSASMGTPDPGIYNISASPTDNAGKSDSGEMKVVGVVSVSGHGKTSTRKATPSGTDKWSDLETIYAQPQSVIELTMVLTPNVTLDDALKNSINWAVSGWGTSITPKQSNKLEATFKPGSVGDYVVTASCGTSQKLIRVKVSAPKIHSVTFSGDITINKDAGGSYSGAAWQDDDLDGDSDLSNANADTGKKFQPVAYQSTAIMDASAVFRPDCRNSADTDFISAYDVEAAVKKVRFTPYSFWSSNNWSTPVALNMGNTSVTAASAFKSAAEVGYDDGFELAWEVGFGEAGTADANLSWERSYSEHELYLTYNAAISSYETVFHISCTNADGDTNANQIVSSIWSEFSDINVKRKGGVTLTYYHSYLTNVTSVGGLLAGTDGQCGSWADFFQTALSIHGIDSDYILFTPLPFAGQGFIVKTWSFSGSGTSGNTDFPYMNAIPANGIILGSSQYNWGTPEEVSYTSGTAGQNNSKPASLFNNHQIIRYGGVYYDPSYGIQHNSLQSIDDSLSGFYMLGSAALLFKKNPVGTQITTSVF